MAESEGATATPAATQASGRIVVPTAFCYDGGHETCRSGAPGDWFAATLFTDDLGATWRVSNKQEGGNECQAAQLGDGSLILNQRTRGSTRQLASSSDGGATWSEPRQVALGGSGAATCCCSTVALPPGAARQASPLVFSGPQSAGPSSPARRPGLLAPQFAPERSLRSNRVIRHAPNTQNS